MNENMSLVNNRTNARGVSREDELKIGLSSRIEHGSKIT